MESEILEVKEKIAELEVIYNKIYTENDKNKEIIDEAEEIQDFNFKATTSLNWKIKMFADRLTVSCLVQIIAVLICIFIILLLKL